MATKAKDREFEMLYLNGRKAGLEAADRMTPVPMIVSEHSNMMDDNSPVKKSWYVADGVCGFAWVVIRPGNSPFANWLKKNKIADKHYYGGVSIWVSDFNQSMMKKEAYAAAMANVFSEAGIKAFSGSRMD